MPTPSPSRSATASLRRVLAAIDLVFCKLNRIQFEAPWRTDVARRC